MRMWFVRLSLMFFSLVSLALFADRPPAVRAAYEKTDEGGTKRKWEYPAIQVLEAKDGDDADLQLFRKQGYEHARLRFFPQMDFFRRLVTARVSALVGSEGNEPDMKALAAGLPEVVDRTLAAIQKDHPTEYKILVAYAAGVNDYIHTHTGVLDKVITSLFPREDWTPRDSVAISVAFSYIQASGLEEMLMLGTVYQKLFAEKGKPNDFADYLDFRPLEPKLPADAKEVPTKAIAFRGLPSLPTYDCGKPLFPFPGCGGTYPGSNAWAVRGKKLKKEMRAEAMLGADPHMILMNPSLFLPMGLDSASAGGHYYVRGETVPGIPAVVIGQNRNIAFTMNNRQGHGDQIYVEQLSPDGKKVRFQNRWVEIETKTIDLKVKNETKQITLRTVPHHGPIISDVWPGIRGLKKDTALSYRWGCAEKSMEFVGILKVNRAENWDEFKEGIHHFCGVAGFFVYADRKGNIGFQDYTSRAPIRKWASKANLPYIPVSGTGEFEWDGYSDKFAEIYNPASDYIAVTNDDMLGRNTQPHLSDFKDYNSYRNTEGIRRKVISDGIENAPGGLDLEGAKKLQFSHFDLLSKHFVEDFLKPIDGTGEISATDAGKRLFKYDFELSVESKEGLVAVSWMHALMSDYFQELIPLDLLPDMETHTYGIQTLYHKLIAERDQQPIQFKARMVRTLNETAKQLTASGNWDRSWGNVHKLTLQGPLDKVLEKIPFFALVPKDIPRAGGFLTPDVGAYVDSIPKDGSIPKTFPNNYGPIFRMICVLRADEETESFSILPRGAGTQLDREGVNAAWELRKYAAGEYGPLVPFIAGVAK